eukprot:TRINITY_DN10280_c0_g1_i1.p1 TRINITY_DN10280_c0_g1~~TRINITY_DN10280_c0_g1_i1.p1  ORF type:complete len:151 (-),score=10.53 TRINITY_DN10280_c0_g1_i1:61-513(-)
MMRLGFVSLLFVVWVGISTVDASSCGGNCPSGRCERCICGDSPHHVSEGEVTKLLKAHALNVDVFQCIVRHESGYNSHAMNQNGAHLVVGLFQQIDYGNTVNYCDPAKSALEARKLYDECGICPWLDDGRAGCFDDRCCGNSYCNRDCHQ